MLNLDGAEHRDLFWGIRALPAPDSASRSSQECQHRGQAEQRQPRVPWAPARSAWECGNAAMPGKWVE